LVARKVEGVQVARIIYPLLCYEIIEAPQADHMPPKLPRNYCGPHLIRDVEVEAVRVPASLAALTLETGREVHLSTPSRREQPELNTATQEMGFG
jgi:hypothetical protein